MMVRLCLPHYVWCALLGLLAGCGKSIPDTAPVRGVVEIDGKGLSGFDNAAVLFTPRGGRMARGVVEPDGSFELSTYGRGDGAIVGPAHVTVSATVDDPSAKNMERGVGVRWIIPERFSDEDSGLSCEVLPGTENFFRIELRSDGTGAVLRQSSN